MTNPANTGFIPDADYRLGANYRNQWSSVMSEPYKTMSIWGRDAQVLRSRNPVRLAGSGWRYFARCGWRQQSEHHRNLRLCRLSSDDWLLQFVVHRF
ncbi:MAG: hypothetical protein WDM78_10285 [Puia sp.]